MLLIESGYCPHHVDTLSHRSPSDDHVAELWDKHESTCVHPIDIAAHDDMQLTRTTWGVARSDVRHALQAGDAAAMLTSKPFNDSERTTLNEPSYEQDSKHLAHATLSHQAIHDARRRPRSRAPLP